MQRTMKTRILALALFCGLSVPVNPLAESTAKYGAIAGGVAAGGITALIIHYGFLKNSKSGTAVKLLLTCLPAAAAGGLTWWLLNDYLYTLTPRGKYQAIEKIMRWVEMDSLIAKDFMSSDEFISHATVRFGTSWPLVLARNHLMLMSTNIAQVHSLIHSILSETSGKAEYADLHEKCEKVKVKLLPFPAKLEEGMNYIAKNDDYPFQVKLHENHLEEARKRAHEEKLKDKEFSHDSWEKTKDRWDKDKDRDLKREALHSNRPLMVNI